MFRTDDYDYDLDDSLIAHTGASPAESARMMVIHRSTGGIHSETTFASIGEFLAPGDLLVLNDTRVIKARLPITAGRSSSHGKESTFDGEIFFLESVDGRYDTFDARVYPGRKFPVGAHLTLFDGLLEIEVIEMTDSGRRLRVLTGDIFHALAEHWEMPLPPYVEPSEIGQQQYQSVFAKHDGSVAAPTASLHFSQSLLSELTAEWVQQSFVTLHVGLGTFKSLDTQDIREYQIHSEACEVSADTFTILAEKRLQYKRIIPVGTTACRVIESLPSLWLELSDDFKNRYSAIVRQWWDERATWENRPIDSWSLHGDSISFRTRCYLFPGASFLVATGMVTNFHLPKTSLMVLVAAMIGQEQLLSAYQHAIEERYRLYSFGDGMLIADV